MKLPKETKLHGKWYGDACGTAFALEVVGERWALLIVRELMFGPRRFSDLRAGLPGISAKVLTERLQSLEQAGVIERGHLPPPGRTQVYGLSEWGYSAEPLIQELGRWAARSSAHDPLLPLSAASLMLSLRTMADYARTGAIGGTVAFVIGDDSFVVEPGEGQLPIHRGPVDGVGAVFRAPVASLLAAAIYAGVPWAAMEREGVVIEGDRDLAMRFASLFSLPEKLA